MNNNIRDWLEYCQTKFPNSFCGTKVLDVGSLDINGSCRPFFADGIYTGIDLGEGEGVDVVADGADYDMPDNYYDVTLSTDCFEHNPFWVETFENMHRMSNHLVIMTCATHGFPEHGTLNSEAWASPLTIEAGWGNYYKNLDPSDFQHYFDLDVLFDQYEFQVKKDGFENNLCFWGVKNKCNAF